MRNHTTSRLFGLVSLLLLASSAPAAENPYVGEWELTIPGGGAGWLGVSESDGKLAAQLLWGGGSVLPVKDVKLEGNSLVFTRSQSEQSITAKREGDTLKLSTSAQRRDGAPAKTDFTGKLQPPLPPAPDLSKVKFGEAIQLFNGKDLTGWRLTDPKAASGWSVKDGILVNDPSDKSKHYGNLRTDREFEDFNLTLEANVGPRQNSGVYLRGIYEIQVADTYGRPLDPHNMGALYSRITPKTSAEKKPGEWQTLDITLVDRHVTVILNGTKIIDNQPAHGCTGGALWSDVSRPGPVYLQGDHTGIQYRNIVLKPVAK